MALTPQYVKTARAQIGEYLNGIQDDVIAIAAAEELKREIVKLAADPALGTAPTGPFETRPIYSFYLEASGKRRRAQVSYEVIGPDLFILLFSCVPV